MRMSRAVCGLAAGLILVSIVGTILHMWATDTSGEAGHVGGRSEPALPVVFEPNVGQVDSDAEFLARGDGSTLLLTGKEFLLSLCRGDDGEPAGCGAVMMSLIGVRSNPDVVGLEPLPGVSNYLIGNDPGNWHTGVQHFGRVRCEQVYRGVDLEFYSKNGQLEYDFVVAPGSDPTVIRFKLSGSGEVAVDPDGNLSVSSSMGELLHHTPTLYQESNGARWPVAGGYVAEVDGSVGFWVGTYDVSRPLVIDPLLSYSTYLGHGGTDRGEGIAVDAAGNMYVTGLTWSFDFPTVNAIKYDLGGDHDAFVSKLSPDGGTLLFSTFLGGSDGDQAYDIALDKAANIWVTGVTSSTNFPTNAALQGVLRGGTDAFVTRMSPAGSTLSYSSYLGGSSSESGKSIAVDRPGYVYLTGETRSSDFPTAFPLHGSLNGIHGTDTDLFVTKLATTLNYYYWSTYWGGSDDERADSIAFDDDGNAYFTGNTYSSDFPTGNAFQPAFGGGTSDAFIAQIHFIGWSSAFSTFAGGSGSDEGWDIWVDEHRNTFVVAETSSTDFPTANAYQPVHRGFSEAAISKLTADGSLAFSTFLGGSGYDRGRVVRTDSAGDIYVGGHTDSTDFPTVASIQSTLAGVNDLFVTKMAITGRVLAYSTYLGGTENENMIGLFVDEKGAAYLTGASKSTDFPTVGAVQPQHGGEIYYDVIVAKLTTPLDFFIAAAALPKTVAAASPPRRAALGSRPVRVASIHQEP